MRRALTRLAIFLLVLLALDRLLFAGAMHLRDAGWAPPEIDLIYRSQWDPAIVFFGDSRTHHHFDMRVVESLTGLSAYNFGRDEGTTAEKLFLLEEYLHQGHRPRLVVFEADVTGLAPRKGRF